MITIYLEVVQGYDPIQPAIENDTVDYKEKYIQLHDDNFDHLLFYQFKVGERSSASLYLVPDLCLDILFSCCEEETEAFFWGNLVACKHIPFEQGNVYFGIRILPEHAVQSSKNLLAKLVNEQILFHEIWDDPAQVAREIAHAKTFEERIELANYYIVPNLGEMCDSSYLVTACLQKMYESQGKITISELAEQVGYSTRYLRKNFEKYIGIPPKVVARIIRFQHALRLIDRKSSEMLDVVGECGYYDYAHLFNELRKFNFETKRFYKR